MKKILVLMGYKVLNYGSALQSCATVEMLKRVGMEPEVLNLDILWGKFRRKKIKFYLSGGGIRFILQSKGGMYLSKVTKLLHPDYRKKIKNRKEKFSLFLEKRLRYTPKVKNLREAAMLSESYDFALLGSDQVWLPSSVVTDVYTLNFVSDNVKKIAYAPSFGIQNIPKRYWKVYRKMFFSINCIALREDSGKKIVEDIAGRKCNVVADPVLMLNRDDWKKIIKTQMLRTEKYAFCYMIGKNKWQREWIIKYASEHNLRTVAIIHLDQRISYDEKFFDKALVDASLEEFLNLIRYAEVVFTDSYHCTLFSLIEHRKFWCFKRFDDGRRISTNSRLYSILKRLSLEERLLTDGNAETMMENNEIDYNDVDKRLDVFREESYRFLIESMERYCDDRNY